AASPSLPCRRRPVSMAGMDPGLRRDDKLGDVAGFWFGTVGMITSERSPTLGRIRAAGVLRVGTTGDYTPFSLRRADGSYEGADIEMAHDLAERLGVRVTFVPTIWVELLDDFLADRFNIAMGGVTVTAARAQKA